MQPEAGPQLVLPSFALLRPASPQARLPYETLLLPKSSACLFPLLLHLPSGSEMGAKTSCRRLKWRIGSLDPVSPGCHPRAELLSISMVCLTPMGLT